jgi:outer membrane protein assembly factor BamB
MRRLRLCIASLVLLSAAAISADWPCFRGAAGDGVVTETDLQLDWPATGPEKLWTAPLGDGGRGTFGGPAIVGGKVYVPGRTAKFEAGKDLSTDMVCCIDAATGKELWRTAFESPSASELSYGNGPRATPLVSGDMVYTLSAFGLLTCLKTADGAKVWQRNIVADFNGFIPKFGVAAAPIIEGDLLICEPGGLGTALVALDRSTGKELWRSGNSKCSYAAPQVATLAGLKQIVAYPVDGLIGLNIADGKELWRIRYNDQKNIAAPVIVGDTIVFSNFSIGMSSYTISQKDGKWLATKNWTNAEKLDTCPPVRLGEHIYYFLYAGKKVKCVALKDGAVKWELPLVGVEENAQVLLVAPQRLIVSLDTGVVAQFEVSPEAGVEKLRFEAVGRNALGCPVISDGRMYIRDPKNLVCFAVKKAK